MLESFKYKWWSKDSDLCRATFHSTIRRERIPSGDSGKSNDLPYIARLLGTSTQGALTRAKSLKLTQIYMLLAVEHPEGMVTISVYYVKFLPERENSLMFWGNPEFINLPPRTTAHHGHFWKSNYLYVYKIYHPLHEIIISGGAEPIGCTLCLPGPQRM